VEEEHLLPEHMTRKWVPIEDLHGLPLTGLARKVLKRLRVLPGYASASTPVKFGAKNTNILPLL
jgi:hypothetical protein